MKSIASTMKQNARAIFSLIQIIFIYKTEYRYMRRNIPGIYNVHTYINGNIEYGFHVIEHYPNMNLTRYRGYCILYYIII